MAITIYLSYNFIALSLKGRRCCKISKSINKIFVLSLPNKIVRNLYYHVSGQKIIITQGFIKKAKKLSIYLSK